MSHISLPTKYEYTPAEENQGTITLEPFFPGYGTTIGNALRRALLSSLEGAAIRAFTVKGVQHEFSSLPGVKEDFVDIMMNLKGVALKVGESIDLADATLSLSASGKKEVTAGDFSASTGIEVMNPKHVIATLTDDQAKFELEAYVGKGYGSTSFDEVTDKTLGMITVDAYYSPIKDIGFSVDNVRVGQMTNYERLSLMIKTNGALTPEEAFKKALSLLTEQFANLEQVIAGQLPEAAPEESADEAEEETVPETESTEEEEES